MTAGLGISNIAQKKIGMVMVLGLFTSMHWLILLQKLSSKQPVQIPIFSW